MATADRDGHLGTSDRLVLVFGSSMLAAWGSTAATVNLAAMLVGEGVVPAGRSATTLGTTATAAAGALLSSLATNTPGGPSTLSARVQTVTSLWGLAGIVVGQRARSLPIAVTAAAAAVAVARPALTRRRSGAHR